MTEQKSRKVFGVWKGMPYCEPTDSFEELSKIKNSIDKNKVINHIESLDEWISSEPSYDIFTGESFNGGLYDDGDFTFPIDFLRYYKKYDIGIPLEYEDYLKTIL